MNHEAAMADAERARGDDWADGAVRLTARHLDAVEAQHGTVHAWLGPDEGTLVPLGPQGRPMIQLLPNADCAPMNCCRPAPGSHMTAGCHRCLQYHRWPDTSDGADAAATWAIRHVLHRPSCRSETDWGPLIFEETHDTGRTPWVDHGKL